jgi:hypothetical protein
MLSGVPGTADKGSLQDRLRDRVRETPRRRDPAPTDPARMALVRERRSGRAAPGGGGGRRN